MLCVSFVVLSAPFLAKAELEAAHEETTSPEAPVDESPIERDDADLTDEIFPPNLSARIEAINALGRSEPQTAVETLLRIERLAEATRIDPEPEVRAHALQLLASTDSDDAYRAIREAWSRDPDRRVRTLAQRLTEERRQPRQVAPTTPRPPGRSAFIIGIVNLAISYAPSALYGLGLLIAGAVGDSQTQVAAGWQLLLPLVGPPLAVISSETDIGYMGIAVVDVIIQAAGFAMLYVGLARHLRSRREHRGASGSAHRQRRVMLAPLGSWQQGGVALVGVF